MHGGSATRFEFVINLKTAQVLGPVVAGFFAPCLGQT
jgi:hypothetical protein